MAEIELNVWHDTGYRILPWMEEIQLHNNAPIILPTLKHKREPQYPTFKLKLENSKSDDPPPLGGIQGWVLIKGVCVGGGVA